MKFAGEQSAVAICLQTKQRSLLSLKFRVNISINIESSLKIVQIYESIDLFPRFERFTLSLCPR